MDTPAPAPGESAVGPHPGTTTRQFVTRTTALSACQPCHRPMDGIGFAFEDLDPIGAHRTTENGLPIDDSGDIGLDNTHQTFHGQVNLMALLAASARQGGDVSQCAVEQWYRFALGRDRDPTWCLRSAWDGSKSLRDLVIDIVTSDPFRYATGCAPPCPVAG